MVGHGFQVHMVGHPSMGIMGVTLNVRSGLELGERVDVVIWQGVRKKRRGRRKPRRGLGGFVVNLCTAPRPGRWQTMGCVVAVEYQNHDKTYSPPSIDEYWVVLRINLVVLRINLLLFKMIVCIVGVSF
jgi:hypothetical protein